MKLSILSLVAVAISLFACGQQISSAKVPSLVLNALKVKYPTASNIDWEMKKNLYEAEFDKDSLEMTVTIDLSGNIKRLEHEINPGVLPLNIVAVLREKYKDYKIDEADKIEMNNKVYYEVELEGINKKNLELVFAEDGKQAEASLVNWKYFEK